MYFFAGVAISMLCLNSVNANTKKLSTTSQSTTCNGGAMAIKREFTTVCVNSIQTMFAFVFEYAV
jgi:hypothetical protein